MKTCKRVVTMLLVLTMLLGMFVTGAAAEEGTTTAPAATLTITYHTNYPAEAGKADGTSVRTYTAGETKNLGSGWSVEGYTCEGWATSAGGSVVYSLGQSFTFNGAVDQSMDLYAVWTKKADDNTGDDDNNQEQPPVDDEQTKAPVLKKGARFNDAVKINCTNNNSHDKYYSWRADKEYKGIWNGKQYYIVANIDVKDYVRGYDYYYDYDCDYYNQYCKYHKKYDDCYKYFCTDNHCKYCSSNSYRTEILNTLFSSINPSFQKIGSKELCTNSKYYWDNCRYNDYGYGYYSDHRVTTRGASIILKYSDRYGWYVADPAVINITCKGVTSTGNTSCNSRHTHTVVYTDGVANQTIFHDKTYSVRHGNKTPTMKDPTRKGYRFLGWSPVVSTYTDECVTYVAKWAPENAPALTTEHVAYLKGYGKGEVRPLNNMTRAEFSTILYRLLDVTTLRDYYASTNNFADVNTGDWYNDAISTLAYAGVIKTTGGNYYPNEPITRAEVVSMLARLYAIDTTYTYTCNFNDVNRNHWAYDDISLAYAMGWIKGVGNSTFQPDAQITRAEVAAVMNRVLGRTNCRTADTKGYVDNPKTAWYYQDIVEATIAH